jgi:hypothetical protein
MNKDEKFLNEVAKELKEINDKTPQIPDQTARALINFFGYGGPDHIDQAKQIKNKKPN